jgi:glutamate carboxypeptidase
MENMSPSPGVTLLITPDEETGSLKSQDAIRDLAKSSKVSVIMEPKLSGNIKKARKGVADFTIHVDGVSAHAGVEPEKGANAIVELSRLVLKAVGLQNISKGTTINVGKIAGGTATNVVPDSADAFLDIRVWTMDEYERVERELMELRTEDHRTSVKVTGGLNRPPMQPSVLTDRIVSGLLSIASSIGINMEAVSVGGGSDGNLIAPLGIPVIDGMGLSGGNAHTRKEFADISRLPQEFSFLCRSIRFILESDL